MSISRWLERNVGYRLLLVHDAIYKRTDGRIGHTIPGAPPSLLLHTIGAKTGKKRINTLTYAKDAGAYLIVASMGGDPKAPGWYHNLKANPNVEINVGPKRFGVTAHIVSHDDPDFSRLWEVVNENNSDRYTNYQKRTTRKIPIIRLVPR